MSKKWEKCSSRFLRAQCDIFKLSFVQTAQNTDSSFIVMNATEKQQILPFKKLNQHVFVLFFIGKMTETIDWLSKDNFFLLFN